MNPTCLFELFTILINGLDAWSFLDISYVLLLLPPRVCFSLFFLLSSYALSTFDAQSQSADFS